MSIKLASQDIMKKGLKIIFQLLQLGALFLILQSCTPKETTFQENNFSLNGDWKFNTIPGQGYNYLQVKEDPTDIIVDNEDKDQIEIKGNWEKRTWAARETFPYRGSFLFREFKKGQSKDNYVRFLPKLKESGNYEVFVRYPFSANLTTQINIQHANGITDVYRSQRNYCDEWLSTGIYKFNKEDKNYIEITALSDLGVGADAIMLKPVSQKVYNTSRELPNQVFKTDYDDRSWNNLKVPGHWGMLNNFSNYNGIGWYRKTFTWPKGWDINDDDKIRIKFGGVYHVSKVYINGKFVGRHQGGFTPFEYDITDFVIPNNENVIAVEVDNNYIVGATWNWGGIIRDVEISKTKDIRIKHQYIHANPDLKKGTAKALVKVTLENNSSEKKNIEIKSELGLENKSSSVQLSQTVEVPANTIKSFTLETTIENVSLWHFDHPNLYTAKTTISKKDKIIDLQTDNFGIRKVKITDSQMFLNGEPVRIGGYNRVSESRYWGSSEPLDVLKEDIDLMKEAGANFMRIMHGTQNEKLIELCDRKGILLFEEVNVRNLNNVEFTAPNFPLIRSWIKGMVERDINHPSIIGWSVGNELTYHYEYGKQMIDYVKTELDPHRLVTCVSNSGQKGEYTPETDPNTFVDVIMHNMYTWQGKPQEILDTLRKKWPNKAIFISEYGLVPIPSTSLDGDLPIISEWQKHYRGKNNFVIGTSLWTFNDYRSGYAGTTAEENRVWGLVNVWRQKRRLFYRMRKENSPISQLSVTNIDFDSAKAEVTITIKKPDDYPSFAIKNYKLTYNFYDNNGEVLSENEVEIPNLKPGDNIWKSTLKWDALSEKIFNLKVDLVNPLGYSRHTETYSFVEPNAPKINAISEGNKSLRVYVDKVYGATEYIARYTNDKGELLETIPTINPYITIEELSNGKSYEIEVIALNKKGKSKSSNIVKATPNNTLLPPIVWKSQIIDNKLIIGYSSDKNDTVYTVQYGTIEGKLSDQFSTNNRGMMSIDLRGKKPLYLRIKRESNGEDSKWSKTYTILKKPSYN